MEIILYSFISFYLINMHKQVLCWGCIEVFNESSRENPKHPLDNHVHTIHNLQLLQFSKAPK